MNRGGLSLRLVSAEGARALDREASESWGLDPPALVEAAGRNCGRTLTEAFPGLFSPPPRITAAAGSGNNGADALVALRALILGGFAAAESSAVVTTRRGREGDRDPRSRALCSLGALGVPVLEWGSREARDALAGSGVIIDGIAGTGLRGPLRDAAGEMAAFVNGITGKDRDPGPFRGPFRPPVVVSIDVPSGNGDFWEPGMPILGADLVLAVEPVKACLYKPAARL
ncbi:MAG: NAD(P)H-hydrate epimerase, partial [Spirochaetaceae bacterium]|nr:NAD(P)H-hydrate epimerase [Spirochaetaceae bacterium]